LNKSMTSRTTGLSDILVPSQRNQETPEEVAETIVIQIEIVGHTNPIVTDETEMTDMILGIISRTPDTKNGTTDLIDTINGMIGVTIVRTIGANKMKRKKITGNPEIVIAIAVEIPTRKAIAYLVTNCIEKRIDPEKPIKVNPKTPTRRTHLKKINSRRLLVTNLLVIPMRLTQMQFN
jgi:hypothetical protein